jgi:hypothetical protein
MTLTELLAFYREQGLCTIPIPLGTKQAILEWKNYQTRLPTDQELQLWFSNDNTNIAIVCGVISGGLVALDCDSEEVFYKLGATIKEKTGIDDVLDFTLISQTGRGYQYLLRVKEPVKSQKFPELDIKAEGGYIVVPPSIHPNGKQYKFLNPNVPIKTINSLADIGIDIKQKPGTPTIPGEQPHWVTEALRKGVAEGQRNDTCFKLAGYFAKRIPQDIARQIIFQWNSRNRPPLQENEVLETVKSAYKNTPTVDINNTLLLYAPENTNLASKRDEFGMSSGRDWGFYAKKFDEVMRESDGRQDKRDVAGMIGLSVTSDTFRKLLQRKIKDTKQVRAYRGSHYLIEWINRDYTITQLDQVEASPMLSIYLPLKIHEYASIPPGSIIGIAGMVDSGKTSFFLEMAELNVFTQPLPVYYWYIEMSEVKMRYRCEDFPLLIQAWKAGKFFPVRQTNFEFPDVLQPDAINLIDYIDRDEDIFLIGADIKKLQTPLNRGIVVFGLQKPGDRDLGYGGNMSIKLSNLYIALDRKYQSEKSMHGTAKIVKAKDWQKDDVNPSGLHCEYHTGGKHGKLFMDGEWKRK